MPRIGLVREDAGRSAGGGRLSLAWNPRFVGRGEEKGAREEADAGDERNPLCLGRARGITSVHTSGLGRAALTMGPKMFSEHFLGQIAVVYCFVKMLDV